MSPSRAEAMQQVARMIAALNLPPCPHEPERRDYDPDGTEFCRHCGRTMHRVDPSSS